jgi:hypothetical protein
MTEIEMSVIVIMLAQNPMAGNFIPGTGGARKLRVAKPGKGKSGGYRVITYYGGENIPVFLLTAFGKSEKENLSKSEQNALVVLTKQLREKYSH